MLLRSFSIAAVLLAAAPGFAEEASATSATAASQLSAQEASAAAQSSGAQGGTCTACTSGGGDTCSVSQAETIPDEEWKEFIRKKLAESQVAKPEPVDPDPFSFSVYRGRRPEPMGTQTIINGGKMEIATLIVPDPPDVVVQAYYEVFSRMGFRPLVGNVPHSPGVRYLSFRPTGSKKLKTVTLVPSKSGTVILASVGNPEELLVKKPELPGGLPVPPNAQAAATIQQMESGTSSQSSSFVVRASTPEEVREFYRRELARLGYGPVAHSAQQDSESFEKAGVILTLSAKPEKNSNNVVVSLIWLQ
ncbi:hypothetical protein [Hyalangium sp.]|uniref:hypothetical protein n=1 Tax=Hyalangium sp. TaxID=2028555 RepID=UPI002D379FD5|nr:hypothetical protein [Hyalangium sp.]HYH94532.1 hypothetical protein [Hyalangium sp.]